MHIGDNFFFNGTEFHFVFSFAVNVLAGVAGDVESFYVGWGEERTPTFTGIGLFLLDFTSSPQPTALPNNV